MNIITCIWQISPAPNSNSIAEAIQNTFRTETTQDQSNNDNPNDDNTVNNSNNTEDMTGSGEGKDNTWLHVTIISPLDSQWKTTQEGKWERYNTQ